MLHPVGPLPASVYWRRRGVAFAAVLLVLLVGWTALPDGGGRQTPVAAFGSPTPDDGSPGSLAATPPTGARGGAGGAGGSEGSAGSAGAGSDPAGTPTAAAPTAAAPSTTAPQPPPKPCADKALELRVLPERPAYQVGQQPVLDLVVRNVSTAACVRDLGAAQQEVLLYDRLNRRLWSSNDCYPGGTNDPQVLGPGDSASFSVTWSGLTSRPRCAGERQRVGPGTYTLLGRLGTLVSKRSPLRLT